tara:strand:- start:29587 stop:30276 length:690 start_codon:yes stop_codon:yes gene_type:complete
MKQGTDRFVPVEKDVKDLILMYRVDHGLSYREIERRLGVSRETARLHCLENLTEEKRKSLKKKKKLSSRKVKNRSVTKKTPLPQYNSVRDYDFLQYIRIVFRWALKTHKDLNRGALETLLFLYPKGAFTYTEFHIYYKTIGMYQSHVLAEFIENGWVKVWKKRTGRSPKLYALTDKSKRLCDDIHKYCVGDKKMSEESDNPIVSDKDVRINTYYVDMIKKMNKRKAPTK